MSVVAAGSDCKTLNAIQRFIGDAWKTLERSHVTIIKSAEDNKVAGGGQAIIYIPQDVPLDQLQDELRRQLNPDDFQRLTILPLPDDVEAAKPGLLYVPYPYIVPGGRFNEMYGWDSYFIVRGLLLDNKVELARNMTDNLVFEVEHYGKVLNANRSYYLSRSQPPFLSKMVLEVYRHTSDSVWLRSTVPALEKFYSYWTTEPHFTPQTGLSRYDGGADTPAPEVLQSEKDIHGRNDYDRIRRYYRAHSVSSYDLKRFYDRSSNTLTPLFYRADRAMRESGFDPSSRFGPFSAGILDYNPVDLNSLLCSMEKDISQIYAELHQPDQANHWSERAHARAAKIEELMWDQTSGMYFDYNFQDKRRSNYRFLTTFYPLWTGIASAEQASRVLANLRYFEKAGGLQTSTRISGDQWDAPFGWAPLQLIAVEGLRRYGFHDAADHISVKFLSMVLHDFERHGTMREKYDVVTRKSDLSAGLRFGYASNEIGFGWTNGVCLALANSLTANGREDLDRECGRPEHS